MTHGNASAGTSRRVALVTGGRANIGLAIVRRLAADGFAVAVHGRDARLVEPVVAGLKADGADALAVTAEIADPTDVDRMVKQVANDLGGVDVLVHNATARVFGPIEEVDTANWQRALDVVVTGGFNCVRACVPRMKKRGWGRIVMIGGIGGQRGFANHSVAGATKGALIGFSKNLADEFGPHGITVNVVSPGGVDTERSPVLGESAEAELWYEDVTSDERIRADIPVGRIGSPEDIAAACSFVCSEEAGYMTGQVLAMNGGQYT